MKKTFKINISGSVFNIDDDAFEMLNAYIDKLKHKFSTRTEEAEVVTDVEARIAELFKERLSNGKEVISLADVKEVIGILGSPDQFDADENEYNTDYEPQNYFANRKLYRDPDDRVLGGVSAGVAHFFGIDPIIIRIIFIVSFFGFGSGLLIYIIMWAVIPEARSTSEKLEMKGEPVNVKNIERSIKHEFESVKTNFQNIKGSEFANQTKDITRKTAGGVVTLLGFIVRLFVIFFGFIIVLTGVSILFSLTVALLAGIGLLPAFGDQSFNEVPILLSHVFDAQETDLFLISLILLIGLPVLGLVYWGFKLIFRFKVEDKVVGIIGLVSWIIGLLMVISIGLFMIGEFKNKGNITNETVLKGITSDTITVCSFEPAMFTTYHAEGIGLSFEDFAIVTNDSSSNVYIRPQFTIEESKTDSFILEVRYRAHGNSVDSARINAQTIQYSYKLEGNKLTLNPYAFFPSSIKFRAQEVKLILKVPMNKTVYLDKSAKEVINDIWNVQNTWDGYMIGNYWVMTKEGLSVSGKLIDPNTGEVMDEEQEPAMNMEPDSLLDPELEDMKEELKTL